MCVLVAVFVFLWQQVSGHKVLHGLVPYGKMSLTNYLSQSIIGSFIYFGYGLSLYSELPPVSGWVSCCLSFSWASAIGG